MSEPIPHPSADDPTLSIPPPPRSEVDPTAETLLPATKREPADVLSYGSIGPYRLVQPLGAGGMGEVWIAEQTEPVKRRVALKLIKGGLGSKEIIARFEAERQALALMNHPNIAKILDAGTTSQGQPYFVMEWVEGQPLNQYCDEQKLGIPARLRLFSDICAGVQHAHQKGIIHRDLKPGNIIVGQQDGVAVPKIIDFGLAKAMENTHRLTEQSLMTGVGQILGTLKYMSPEQASLDNLDIDTRSDVYSLGVILYELLTGSTPLDNSAVRGQAALQVLEFIRDREAIKPSSKLAHSGADEVSQITQLRQTDRSRLQRILAGDLDWIVMKALEKDRGRRYDSASDFAADVQRYLSSEPVSARPPSLAYRIRKFVRKNYVGVVAVALVFLALLGGMAGTSWSLLWALRAEEVAARRADEAESARQEEQRQRQFALEKAALARQQEALANQNATRAEQEQRIAEAVRDFLQNKLLRQASVWNQANESLQGTTTVGFARYDISVRELLDRAAEEYTTVSIESKFPGQPIVQSEILETIGATYLSVGEDQKALKLLESALKLRQDILGQDDPTVIAKRIDLVFSYLQAQRQSAAIGEAAIVVDQLLRKMEDWISARDNLPTANARQIARDDVGQAIANATNAIETRFTVRNETIYSVDLSAIEAAMSALRIAQVLPKTLRLAELCEQEFGAGDRRTIYAQFVHACCLHALGQVKSANTIFAKIHLTAENELPADDLLLAGVRVVLAESYTSVRDFSRAIALQHRVIPVMEAKLGNGHPATIAATQTLAVMHFDNQNPVEALPLFKRTYELCLRNLGPYHLETLTYHSNMASCLVQLDRAAEAVEILESVYEFTKGNKTRLDELLPIQNNLAHAYRRLKQYDKAIELYEQTIEQAEIKFGAQYNVTLLYKENLLAVYTESGQYENVISLANDVIVARGKTAGVEDPSTIVSRLHLIGAYNRTKRWPDSLIASEDLLRILIPHLKHAREVLPGLLEALRVVYRQTNQPTAAIAKTEAIYKEFLDRLGEQDILTLDLMQQFTEELVANSAVTQAVELSEKQVKLETEMHGPLHSRTLRSEIRLADILLSQQKCASACDLLEAMGGRLTDIDFQHESSVHVLEKIISGYQKCNDQDNASRWETQLTAHLLQVEEPDLAHGVVLATVGLRRLQQSNWEASESVLQRCLDIRQRLQPEHWTVHNTEAMLGAALLGQQRYAEAEPLLLAGYEGMVRHQSELPSTADIGLTEALDRLIELYTAMGQSERQQFYRSLRDHATPTAIDEDT